MVEIGDKMIINSTGRDVEAYKCVGRKEAIRFSICNYKVGNVRKFIVGDC